MREDLLIEAERDLQQLRSANEREEEKRRERIRKEEPEIDALIREREELVFGTLTSILHQGADSSGLPERMGELSARIRSGLAAKGYPEDYLEPVYRCALCRDTGRTGETVREICVCLKKAYQQKLREKIGLAGGRSESFENFDLSVFPDEKLPGEPFSQREQMAVFRDDCREWTDRYPENERRDVLLSGESGLGKTYLLHSMAERLIGRDVNVLIVSAYRMLDILRESYFNHDRGADELFGTDVLMIDDLGSEPLMQNVTVEQLFNLINERQNRGLSTVISTNLDMPSFRKRYTERIASRLTDTRRCMVLTLTGRDIRRSGRSTTA